MKFIISFCLLIVSNTILGNHIFKSEVLSTPEAVSIKRQNPMTSPTSNDVVVFRVTFNENVVNVNATDFELSGNASISASIINVTGSGTTYDLTVVGIADATGELNLDFSATQNIEDTSGNVFAGIVNLEESYIIDNNLSVTNTDLAESGKLLFSEGKFTYEAAKNIYVYNLLGQQISNNNLGVGLYIVKIVLENNKQLSVKRLVNSI
ncbi:hypothetical protein [Pseudofulvibacter geojedonensis]|uniref:Secretion system C-terminal sorting domain-containing protein n=1 Tax=Pseudofulvibacter geojedonensis TaxID=1123758 RepID=A0ABW3I5K5_9FLAO